MTDTPSLTLGAVLFPWRRDSLQDFYFRIADEAPVDTVIVGESVCLRRKSEYDAVMQKICDRLKAAGKNIRLALPLLPTTEQDMQTARAEMTAFGDYLPEAADMSSVALCVNTPHHIGPSVNCYHQGMLSLLAKQGARSVCLPPELPAKAIQDLASNSPLPLEVLAFGALPLSVSARCMIARYHNRPMESCGKICLETPDGIPGKSLDGSPFLRSCGTVVIADGCLSLLPQLPALQKMGIASFRLSPCNLDMVQVATEMRDILDGKKDPASAGATLTQDRTAFINGFYHGVAGHKFLQ